MRLKHIKSREQYLAEQNVYTSTDPSGFSNIMSNMYSQMKKTLGYNSPIKTDSKFVQIPKKMSEYDAILIGGLDYRPGDYDISRQVELFKKGKNNKGFGENKKVKGFRYNTPTSEILAFLKENQKLPIFMFSAGCIKALELSKSPYADKQKMFVIEPYAADDGTKKIIQDFVNNGGLSANVFVGGNVARGLGVVPNASSSEVAGHWDALPKVGEKKSNVV
jgi:hypothetical protein